MQQLNAELKNDIGEGRFVTFVAAVCEPGNSRVELLSAGHGPSFIYVLSEDRFEEMHAQGLPLGIASCLVSDPPATLELNTGDLLVLATDGFLEWTNWEGEQFGVKRLEETIRNSRQKPPANLFRLFMEPCWRFLEAQSSRMI